MVSLKDRLRSTQADLVVDLVDLVVTEAAVMQDLGVVPHLHHQHFLDSNLAALEVPVLKDLMAVLEMVHRVVLHSQQHHKVAEAEAEAVPAVQELVD
jgi:hypothetical protein